MTSEEIKKILGRMEPGCDGLYVNLLLRDGSKKGGYVWDLDYIKSERGIEDQLVLDFCQENTPLMNLIPMSEIVEITN